MSRRLITTIANLSHETGKINHVTLIKKMLHLLYRGYEIDFPTMETSVYYRLASLAVFTSVVVCIVASSWSQCVWRLFADGSCFGFPFGATLQSRELDGPLLFDL